MEVAGKLEKHINSLLSALHYSCKYFWNPRTWRILTHDDVV